MSKILSFALAAMTAGVAITGCRTTGGETGGSQVLADVTKKYNMEKSFTDQSKAYKIYLSKAQNAEVKRAAKALLIIPDNSLHFPGQKRELKLDMAIPRDIPHPGVPIWYAAYEDADYKVMLRADGYAEFLKQPRSMPQLDDLAGVDGAKWNKSKVFADDGGAYKVVLSKKQSGGAAKRSAFALLLVPKNSIHNGGEQRTLKLDPALPREIPAPGSTAIWYAAYEDQDYRVMLRSDDFMVIEKQPRSITPGGEAGFDEAKVFKDDSGTYSLVLSTKIDPDLKRATKALLRVPANSMHNPGKAIELTLQPEIPRDLTPPGAPIWYASYANEEYRVMVRSDNYFMFEIQPR